MNYEYKLLYNVLKIFGLLGFAISFHEIIHILHSIYFHSYIQFDIDDYYNPTTHFTHRSNIVSLFNYILAIIGGYIPIILSYTWNIIDKMEFVVLSLLYSVGCIHDLIEIIDLLSLHEKTIN